jgi:hypothetical protein
VCSFPVNLTTPYYDLEPWCDAANDMESRAAIFTGSRAIPKPTVCQKEREKQSSRTSQEQGGI